MCECAQELCGLPRVSISALCVASSMTTQLNKGDLLLLSLNGSEPCECNRLDYLSQALPSVVRSLDASLEKEQSNILIPQTLFLAM